MSVGCVLDELPVADKHPRVRDVLGRRTKKQQVTGLQLVALHWRHSVPRCLLIGVPRHSNASRSHEHLRETGAVKSKARRASPQIRSSKEMLGEFDGFGNR